MRTEITVPVLPESVSSANLMEWQVHSGQRVEKHQLLIALETDKIILEVVAPEAGTLVDIHANNGETVKSGQIIATLDTEASARTSPQTPALQAAAGPASTAMTSPPLPEASRSALSAPISPAVRRMLAEHQLFPEDITGSGKEGRLTRQDVLDYLDQQKLAATNPVPMTPATALPPIAQGVASPPETTRSQRRQPMSRLRSRIAERMLDAQHQTATLTTFNEVNLHRIFELRHLHKQRFEQEHGVKLGYMSFFVKAVVAALQRFPVLNASIEGDEIIFHDFYDVGIAVSTERGLVVPILRDADQQDFGQIESAVLQFSQKARDGKLTMEELTGGTFTITNGGIYGSMLSTPILNPPQSAILGMHAIKDRAVVENGEIVIRPIIYLALSYDHRIIDGRDAVSFLFTIKELLEEPSRLLLKI